MIDNNLVAVCDEKIAEHRATIEQFEQALAGDLDAKTRKQFEKVIREALKLIQQAERVREKTIKEEAGGGAGASAMSRRPRKPARYCAGRPGKLRGV